jgi:hypothetical protein
MRHKCLAHRNLCSQCIKEKARYHKAPDIEQQFLQTILPNSSLEPLVEHFTKAITLKKFRSYLKLLPAFSTSNFSDATYGASKYLAITLGLLLKLPEIGAIDEPLLRSHQRDLWRQANFSCMLQTHHNCHNNHY